MSKLILPTTDRPSVRQNHELRLERRRPVFRGFHHIFVAGHQRGEIPRSIAFCGIHRPKLPLGPLRDGAERGQRGVDPRGVASSWYRIFLVSFLLRVVSSCGGRRAAVSRGWFHRLFWRIFRGVSHFSVFEKVQRRKSSLVFCFGNDCDLVPIFGRGSEDRELCDADDAVVEEREREYWSRRTSSKDMDLAFWRIGSSSSRCSWNLDCMVAEGVS